MSKSFRDRITAAPLLPARIDALKTCERYVSLLDDPEIVARINAEVLPHEPSRKLLAGVLAHSPFLTRVLRRHADWLPEGWRSIQTKASGGSCARSIQTRWSP